MKKFFSDFKAFAMKGNVVDMAVGVIIGSAFGKIVTSLVNDIITPLISLAIGKMDLTGLEIVFRAGTVDPATGETVGKVALTYGNFIQSVIDFLIIAMCIFVVLRLITNAEKKIESLTKKKEEEKAEEEEEAKETELDLLREMASQRGDDRILTVCATPCAEAKELSDYYLCFDNETKCENALVGPELLTAAQMIALRRSESLGIDPDDPNPAGVVNRVVKGVTIYEYERG